MIESYNAVHAKLEFKSGLTYHIRDFCGCCITGLRNVSMLHMTLAVMIASSACRWQLPDSEKACPLGHESASA